MESNWYVIWYLILTDYTVQCAVIICRYSTCNYFQVFLSPVLQNCAWTLNDGNLPNLHLLLLGDWFNVLFIFNFNFFLLYSHIFLNLFIDPVWWVDWWCKIQCLLLLTESETPYYKNMSGYICTQFLIGMLP